MANLDGSVPLGEILEQADLYRNSDDVYDPEELCRYLEKNKGLLTHPLCSLQDPVRFDLLVTDSTMPKHEVEQLCFSLHARDVPSDPAGLSFSNKPMDVQSRLTLQSLHEHLSARVPAYVSSTLGAEVHY
jgi:hypothetical protein